MSTCAHCAKVAGNGPIRMQYGEEDLRFCSFECLIVHSANRVCRRLARQKRRIQKFLKEQRLSENAPASRAAKSPVN